MPWDANEYISVYRRNQSLDSSSPVANALNEPVYGDIFTSASQWQILSQSLAVLVDDLSGPDRYLPTGERIIPKDIIYAPGSASITEEDRIVFQHSPIGSGSLYIVTSVNIGYDQFGRGADHLELSIRLP